MNGKTRPGRPHEPAFVDTSPALAAAPVLLQRICRGCAGLFDNRAEWEAHEAACPRLTGGGEPELGKTFTPQQETEIARLRGERMSAPEIAKALDLDVHQVAGRLSALTRAERGALTLRDGSDRDRVTCERCAWVGQQRYLGAHTATAHPKDTKARAAVAATHADTPARPRDERSADGGQTHHEGDACPGGHKPDGPEAPAPLSAPAWACDVCRDAVPVAAIGMHVAMHRLTADGRSPALEQEAQKPMHMLRYCDVLTGTEAAARASSVLNGLVNGRRYRVTVTAEEVTPGA